MNHLYLSSQPLWLVFGFAACVSSPAWAQAGGGASERLGTVVVTGNPLGSQELAPANHVLTGDALVLSRGASLGESLQGLSGVSSTYFGPNANRPSIRGLDGDRVRMLNNSGASVDASSLSFDHAVPVDPLVIERIEVLRGAAALLYGGNAIGGVVNTLDNRIPRQAQTGLSGAAELRLGGAAQERNAAVVLDGGAGHWAWHADAAGRRSEDQRVPAFSTAEDGWRRSVRNSASDSRSLALGSAWVGTQGFAGLSVDEHRQNYGVTVEPDVTVQMQRQRIATAGEWRDAAAPVRKLQWQLSHSRYEHREVEGDGAIGTTFKSRGNDGRLEAEHAPLGPWHGLLGLQWEGSNFSALGEEALVPSTHTRSSAAFVLEQARWGAWGLSAGARVEQVRVSSEGDAAGAEEKFGAAMARQFKPRSLSLGGSVELGQGWAMTANLTHSQRAPMYYELFAQGVHVATGAFERGDAALGLERARGAEWGVRWSEGANSVSAQVYDTRFGNYLALAATGQVQEVDGQSLPAYAYQGVRARLRGFELELKRELPAWGGWQLALAAQLDAVRGDDLSHGEPLPRLAPMRAGLGLDAQQGSWSVKLDWRLAARQNRVPATDRATAGYGLVKLSVARQVRWGELDALWYLKLDNLGNQLAYSASSIATIRDLSPLPGRSVHTGLQVRF